MRIARVQLCDFLLSLARRDFRGLRRPPAELLQEFVLTSRLCRQRSIVLLLELFLPPRLCLYFALLLKLLLRRRTGCCPLLPQRGYRRAPTPTAAAEIAVPVRSELQAAIDDLAHRKKRCASRPVTLGRERLEARAGRLPRPESLLQAQTQRLDDMAERLKRGLKDRAAQARERLQGDSAKLSAPLLRARWTSARDRLAAARLVPTLPQRRLTGDRQRFDALARLYASLDPEAPLQRGFVLVKDAEGHLVRSRAVGAMQPLLEVKFADGTLAVVPQGQADSPRPSAPLPSTRKAKRAKSASAAAQDDLFG